MARKGDGLYLRGSGEKATKTWWLDFRRDGTRHVARIGKGISRTVARELASVKRADILKGEAGISPKKKLRDISFEKAKDEFLNWAETNLRRRTVISYRECLRHLAQSFAGKALGGLCTLDVERHKRMRAEAGARVRANREVAVFSTLCNRCKEWGLSDADNPTKAVKKLEEPEPRLRYLGYDEEARLLPVSPPLLRDLIALGVNTGLRIRGEALELRRSDVEVDLRKGVLRVESTYAKNKKSREIPVNEPAMAALRWRLDATSGERLFDVSYSTLLGLLNRACKRAGLDGTGLTPHSCRHTFASRLAMAGVDLRTIQELGGWSDLSMVQRYAHVSPTHKANAVGKIAAPIHNPIHNTAVSLVKEVACG